MSELVGELTTCLISLALERPLSRGQLLCTLADEAYHAGERERCEALILRLYELHSANADGAGVE